MPILTDQTWFVTNYILLYISIPIINILIKNLNKTQYKLILIIGVTIFSVCPTMNVLTAYKSNYVWFIILYLTGAYIKKYNVKIKHSLLITIGTIGLYLMFFFLNFGAFTLGRFNFLFYIMAVMIFNFVANKKEKSNIIINQISISTLGIYLIHENIFIRNSIYNYPISDIINAYIQTGWFWIYMLLLVFSIYIICLGIDQLRIFLIECPVMKLVNKCLEKIKKNVVIEKAEE